MLWSSKWLLSFSSASKTIRIFSSPLRSTLLAYLILVDLITLKYLVRYRSQEPPLHNFPRSHVVSSVLGPNTLFNPFSSDTVSVLPLL